MAQSLASAAPSLSVEREGSSWHRRSCSNRSRRSASAATSWTSPTATCATTWSRASWPSRPRTLARGGTAARRGGRASGAEQAERAEEKAALLRKTVLTIAHQAGDDGRLFGSVTAQEIADAVRQARGVKLDKRRIQLTEPIKTTGTHMVTVEVADGVTADVKTIVTAE